MNRYYLEMFNILYNTHPHLMITYKTHVRQWPNRRWESEEGVTKLKIFLASNQYPTMIIYFRVDFSSFTINLTLMKCFCTFKNHIHACSRLSPAIPRPQQLAMTASKGCFVCWLLPLPNEIQVAQTNEHLLRFESYDEFSCDVMWKVTVNCIS